MASLLLLAAFLAQPAAAADPAYKVNFDGSVQYLSTGETGKVLVKIGPGSPGGEYNYTVAADKGSVTPTKGTSSADNLTITVSAPATTGSMVVTVTLSNGQDSTTSKYTVKVVEPVVISATVKNSAQVSHKGVPVQFFVDNEMVNQTTFDIDANSTKDLTYRWTTPGLDKGEHSLKVIIDPEKQYQFLSFADDSREYTSKFYVGDGGWGILNTVLALTMVLLLFILFLTYAGRNRKRKR